MEPWNDPFLLPPPVHTSICDENFDVKGLTYVCKSIITVLSKQSPLHREAAILSRFLYKFDKKFRNDIGYRYFKKVNTALKRYLVVNLLKDIENFASVLPEDDVYLPTRQMLEYILVRLITFSKLMIRINVCSKQAAVFYFDRVKRGESHWMSFMPYSLLSRIWSLSMVLIQHACNWYSNLHPFLQQLKLKGVQFLPETYKLPVDLEAYLEIRNLDNNGRFEWLQKKQVDIDPNLMEEDENARFDSILDYVSQINSDETPEEKVELKTFTDKLKNSQQFNIATTKNVDQGEAISREHFNNISMGLAFRVLSETKHSFETVTSKNSLKNFIETEEKLRNENSNESLTNHLSFMQWQALQSILQKLHDSIDNNRKIERKFKKMWKEKCLDYK